MSKCLRDCHACVGVVESTVIAQPSDIRFVRIEVYDVATFGLYPIFVEVGEINQGRMASRAVVTLFG